MGNSSPGDRASRSEIKQILSVLGLRPSKSRGQNFLFDRGALSTIAAFSEIDSAEHIIEIGAGLGHLTEFLIGRGASLTLVEVEPQLCVHLNKRFGHLKGCRIVNADVRKLKAADLLSGANLRLKIVSNAPYSISSELIFWVLANKKLIKSASLLLQKEFVQRISAEPGSKHYGSITVQRTLSADIRVGPVISRFSFYPLPDVDSQLIELMIRNEPRAEVLNEELFQRVVRASFSTRRKTLLNCLVQSKLVDSKEAVRELLQSLSIDSERRGETLSVKEFASIANRLAQFEWFYG